MRSPHHPPNLHYKISIAFLLHILKFNVLQILDWCSPNFELIFSCTSFHKWHYLYVSSNYKKDEQTCTHTCCDMCLMMKFNLSNSKRWDAKRDPQNTWLWFKGSGLKSQTVTHGHHSPPGSFVYEIFQVRILEWVPISSSKRSSWPRDWTCVSCKSPALAGEFFTSWATRELSIFILAALGLPCFALAYFSCSEQALLVTAVLGLLLRSTGSRLHGLQQLQSNSSGSVAPGLKAQAQQLRFTGLLVLCARDPPRTGTESMPPCTSRQIPNYCTTRKVWLV